jgi:hypothetical protein
MAVYNRDSGSHSAFQFRRANFLCNLSPPTTQEADMSIASDPKHCPQCQTPLPGDAPQGLCPKCLLAAAAIPTEAGQPAPDQTPPGVAELAAAFPQLEILELIGQGGMGFVFKARQPKLDRFVALKILPQSLAADPAFAERFSREGRVLAKLNHPNIVTVHDFGVASGRAAPLGPRKMSRRATRPAPPPPPRPNFTTCSWNSWMA